MPNRNVRASLPTHRRPQRLSTSVVVLAVLAAAGAISVPLVMSMSQGSRSDEQPEAQTLPHSADSAPPPASTNAALTPAPVPASLPVATATPDMTPTMPKPAKASTSSTSTREPAEPRAPRPAASLGGCPNLPHDDIWHADVSKLPRHRRSAEYVASIGAQRSVKADFGSGLWEGEPIGIPITYVDRNQRPVPVTFDYDSESDKGPFPIPTHAIVEGGPGSSGDRHVLVVDKSSCRLHELWDAHSRPGGSWHAGSGAVFDLRSSRLRPKSWTSADAAGLPIAPGLVRYEEVAAGRIDHAIRVTVPKSQNAYLWPARHAASSSTDKSLPPMGLRLRLKASVELSHLPAQARVVAEAMKTFGVVVADNGSAWYLSGAPDPRWHNDALSALSSLHGGDFEAVETSSLMTTPNSGRVR